MDEKYTELEMKESVFYWKMRAQQEAMPKKCHNLPVKTDDLLPIDLDESNSESAEITTPLNVPLDNCGFICVPLSILARQYNCAAMILVCKEQNIISDLGKGDNFQFYVANTSVSAPSYIVCNAQYGMERTMRVALPVLILRPMAYVHIL